MPGKSRHHKRNRFLLIFSAILLCLLAWIIISLAKFIPTVYQLFFHKEIELKKTQEQRINMLLLGIGGGVHDGPLLTDTIIFASIDPQKKLVTLVSIPRDLWVPDMQAKINTAYAYGEAKEKGGGLKLTKAAVQKIIGQPIDYGFRIDFGGFVKAVDMVGGLDLTVDRTFDDYEYPISGKEQDDCGFTGDEFEKRATDEAQLEAFPCRYEHLHFDKGASHMDGLTALTYVRSRHALGPEGTDFARSKRQEKVIKALKDKVLSVGTLLNPVKVVGLFDTLKDSIDTDIQQQEYDDFIKLAEKMRDAKIQSAVIDLGDEETGREGLLVNPPISQEYKLQWVIVPKAGTSDYSEVHTYVSCVIKTGTDCLTATPTPSPLPKTK